MHLSTTITKRLKLSVTTSDVEIKFQPNEKLPPMLIDDDESLEFFLELHKKNIEVSVYPLLVSVKSPEISISKTIGECSQQNIEVGYIVH